MNPTFQNYDDADNESVAFSDKSYIKGIKSMFVSGTGDIYLTFHHVVLGSFFIPAVCVKNYHANSEAR